MSAEVLTGFLLTVLTALAAVIMASFLLLGCTPADARACLNHHCLWHGTHSHHRVVKAPPEKWFVEVSVPADEPPPPVGWPRAWFHPSAPSFWHRALQAAP